MPASHEPSDAGSELHALRAENEHLQKEVLRLRDAVIGKEAELGTALGRVAELESELKRYVSMEQRLNDVLGSTSWRLMWAAGAPVRKLRERRS